MRGMAQALAGADKAKTDSIGIQIEDTVLRGQMFLLNMSKHKKGKKKGQYKYIEMKGLGDFNTHGKTD